MSVSVGVLQLSTLSRWKPVISESAAHILTVSRMTASMNGSFVKASKSRSCGVRPTPEVASTNSWRIRACASGCRASCWTMRTRVVDVVSVACRSNRLMGEDNER